MHRTKLKESSGRSLSRIAVATLAVGATSLLALPAAAQQQTCFDYTGAIETWEVPAGVTVISAEAWGAQGGDSTYGTLRTGGLGAYVSGDVSVTPGESLQILVGGRGESLAVGGGGGGSFLVSSTNMPLLVAGGGGGASSDENGVGATVAENGTADSLGLISGGTGGAGGNACLENENNGGGGAGFSTDGATAPALNSGVGGIAFLNGGTIVPGGRNDGACTADPSGGFGGGGSATCNTVGGGGGGGYSGGAGGPHLSNCGAAVVRAGGGGGGSFNSGSNQVNTPADRSGNGQICISAAVQPPAPVPPSIPVPTLPLYGLVLTTLGVLTLAMRRLRRHRAKK
jgi:hypothetical protein